MNVQRHCRRSRRRIFAAGLVLLFASATPAAATPINFRVERWQTREGLQQNTVKTLCQTPDGYLWIGTRFGYARYDGVRFAIVDRQLKDLNSIDMAVDRKDGSLWVLSMRNVIHWTGSGFQTIDLKGPWQEGGNGIGPSASGGVWIAADFGLLRVERDEPARHPLATGNTDATLRAVVEDDAGHVWVGAPEGLVVYDPASRTRRIAWRSPTNSESANPVTAIVKRRAGGFWIGTSRGELYWHHRDQTTRVFDIEPFGANEILRIVEASDRSLWIVAHRRRLFRWNEPTLERITTSHGLSDDEVHTVFEDREANLWVGTESGGLHRIQPQLIRTLSPFDGLAADRVWSICSGRDGVLWIGTQEGLSRYQHGQFDNYSLGNAPQENEILSVREDRRGVLWVGTRGRGLKRFKDGQSVTFSTTKSSHDQINGIYEDRAGTLWISTLEGLVELRDDQIVRRLTTTDGLPHHEVRAVHEARDGTLWIGTRGGVATRAPGSDTFRVYTTSNGLADNCSWCFHEDPEGGIWIGSEYGLTWYDGTGFHVFTTDQGGLYDNVVNDIIEDDDENLWIGCNRGIYRVPRIQFREIANKTRLHLDYLVYGTAQGMLHDETNGEHQPSACRAPDGSIWFPTVRGAVQIHPERMHPNQLPPPLVIEAIIFDDQPVPLPGPAALPAGRGRKVEFRYTANSLADPANVRLRYQLLNFDSEPQFDSGERRKLYTNLKPGSYEFRVTGCNNHGVWNLNPATFKFTIAPYPHQTATFYIVLFTLLVAGAYALHRRRLNTVRHIHHLERELAVDGERTRIASEMHDDLGSHLTQIALLGEIAARELPPGSPATTPVRQIADASRDLFRAMDEVVWAVNPKHDTLDALANYLCQHAQDFLRSSPVRCRLDVPEELPAARVSADTRHSLFLAFKEALNNAVRHAAASEIRVSLSTNHHTARLTVEDNGRGFDPASRRPGGDGLDNIKRRLAVCGGSADLRSTPGRGTIVQLNFPLQPASPPA